MKDQIKIRPAALTDVDGIFALLELYVAQGIVLKRSKEDISFFIGNFTVAELDGKVCGCAALRDFGNDLLELRSVVISPDLQGKGIGKILVASMIERLKAERQNWRLFTLTTTPAFFESLGFKVVSKEEFPEKIWSDCSKCPKFHCCDETALLVTT
jgi:amino-acid N-acetyltransferase